MLSALLPLIALLAIRQRINATTCGDTVRLFPRPLPVAEP